MRNYYKRNSDLYKLRSLLTYYVKQLEKTDLSEKKRENYQNTLNEIEANIVDMEPIKKAKKNEVVFYSCNLISFIYFKFF